MNDRRFRSKRRPIRLVTSPWHPENAATRPASQRSGLGRGRAAASALAVACVAALLLLPSCANLGAHPATTRYEPPKTVSSAVTFAASPIPPAQEVEYLERARTPAALLRRAWLQLKLQRNQDALDSAAQVIFTQPAPSAHVEAFARYLRAEAYRAKGLKQRGAFDLQRAQQLALDPDLQRRLGVKPRVARPRNASARAAAPVANVAIQRRGAWRPKRENRSNLDRMQRPSRVTIHHSAMYFRSTAPSAAAAQISRIQREHMNNRGYGDIGYHFLIDPSGRVWEGRELRWQGAHASGDNNIGNIGICLLGNFVRERGGQGPTSDQIQSMERLVVSLMQRYRMRPDALYCHSDFKSTACPGPRMAPIVKQFARQLRARGYTAEEDEE